jgi:predicted RNase H-like HicB family nuclease
MGKNQNSTKIENSIKVEVSILLLKENGNFVAYCPALELSSYGDSEQEAKGAFEEALEIFLEETTHKGTLEKELLKRGWTLQQSPKVNYHPPRISEKKLFQLMKSKTHNVITEKIAIPY